MYFNEDTSLSFTRIKMTWWKRVVSGIPNHYLSVNHFMFRFKFWGRLSKFRFRFKFRWSPTNLCSVSNFERLDKFMFRFKFWRRLNKFRFRFKFRLRLTNFCSIQNFEGDKTKLILVLYTPTPKEVLTRLNKPPRWQHSYQKCLPDIYSLTH